MIRSVVVMRAKQKPATNATKVITSVSGRAVINSGIIVLRSTFTSPSKLALVTGFCVRML